MLKDMVAEEEDEAPKVKEEVGDWECVLLPDTVLLAVSVVVPLGVGVEEGVEVGEPVGVLEGVPEPLVLPEAELDPVLEGDTPTVNEGVGEPEVVEVALRVGGGVPLPDGEAVPVGEAVGLGEEVSLEDAEAGREEVGVWEGEAPTEREAVGGNVGVVLAVEVELGVMVAVKLDVGVGVDVGLCEGAAKGVPVGVKEMVGVTEAVAPVDKEEVGEVDRVVLPLTVLLLVPLGVSVELPVGDSVGGGVREAVGVGVGDWEMDPVCDALAPRLSVGVGIKDTVVLPLTVLELVTLPVPVGETVREEVGV